jgi:hypothetical protein
MEQDSEKERDRDAPGETVEVKCDFCDVKMIAVAPRGGFPKPCVLCDIGKVYPVSPQG